jgi:hypothetical protein
LLAQHEGRQYAVGELYLGPIYGQELGFAAWIEVTLTVGEVDDGAFLPISSLNNTRISSASSYVRRLSLAVIAIARLTLANMAADSGVLR